jgi:DNA-binding IclR family transcriptional regulator
MNYDSEPPAAEAMLSAVSPASQTLVRGLDVLEQVAEGPVALSTIARQLGLSRSTVHRLATTLLERRYLNVTPRRGYSLGPKLLELGFLARDQISLVRLARPYLEALAARTGDVALLAVPDGDDVLVADHAAGRRRVVPSLRAGDRLAAHGCALGEVLAGPRAVAPDHGAPNSDAPSLDAPSLDAPSLDAPSLDAPSLDAPSLDAPDAAAAARDDVVVDDGHSEIRIIAAPVRGADGRVRAAFGIAAASVYADGAQLDTARAAVREAAGALSAELGWRVSGTVGTVPATAQQLRVPSHRVSGVATGGRTNGGVAGSDIGVMDERGRGSMGGRNG